MKLLQAHRELLQKAADLTLPPKITEYDAEHAVTLELVEAGYLKADTAPIRWSTICHAAITVQGREYLESLNDRAFNSSFKGRFVALLKRASTWLLLAIGAGAGKAIELAVEKLMK